jgi:hypothetical protein
MKSFLRFFHRRRQHQGRDFYESIAAEFETRIADLHPTEAYATIRQTALNLAKGGSAIGAQLQTPDDRSAGRSNGLLFERWVPGAAAKRRRLLNIEKRVMADLELQEVQRGIRQFLSEQLRRAYGLYASGELQQALEIAYRVNSRANSAMDHLSAIDALHLIGRIHYDGSRFSEAEECFADEMDRSLGFSVAPAFVRAVYEASRVRFSLYDLLRAEFGFRLAWDYYTARKILFGQSGSNDAPGSDLQNASAAIRSLRTLSETYFYFERGPKEANELSARLASPHFSDRDLSGAAFLEVRGFATGCIGSIPKHRELLARMASRAMTLRRTYPQMSSFMLEEAEYVAKLQGDAFPFVLRLLFARRSGLRQLKSAPFYKPDAMAITSVASTAPFATPACAAENASVLYRYLKDSDGQGRYVYRGQTAHYEGPLLPSAFRPILAEKYGRTVKSNADSLYDKFSLRKSGRLFYGEYDACFQQYANPVGHLIGHGTSTQKMNAAARLYERILNHPGIPLAQEGRKFVPWIEALRKVLPPEEYDLFCENKGDWMPLINSHHRRIYRLERFIALFGYTLGTTIAQQYGFLSEGLDATKSIDVAFFFATRDSSDFRTIAKEGLGVIYRIPFPQNGIAAEPLRKYNYYSLPSIVDVNDVIYRFEVDGLASFESRTCLDAYFGASLIDGFRDLDLLLLPQGFYGTTRVAKQDAVIILPDEIREDYRDRMPGVDGIRVPKRRYIEDLAAREGVMQFYFKHTGEGTSCAATISREDLWPRDDFLLEVIVRIILGTYRLRKMHPKRPELIDVGYENEAFAEESSERFWANCPIFFSEYEKLGARFGAVTL